MKKLLTISIVAICMLSLSIAANAGIDQTKTATVNATVGTTFSMEWENNATSDNVLFPGGGPVIFSNVDPASNLNYPDGRTDGDIPPKPDIALICKTNEDAEWQLKTDVSGVLAGKLLISMLQPRVDGSTTGTGVVPDTAKPDAEGHWPVITNGALIYTSGDDKVNTPNGSFCGINIGLNGGGLTQGSYQGSTITFTMTGGI